MPPGLKKARVERETEEREIKMRIMFLTHLPENPKAKERYAKIQAQLNSYASTGTQVELCFPDDYPGAKLSVNLGARNEVPGLYHVLQTPSIIRKFFCSDNNGIDAAVTRFTFDPILEAVTTPLIN